MKEYKTLLDLRKAIDNIPTDFNDWPVVVGDSENGCFPFRDIDISKLEDKDFYAMCEGSDCICIES